MLSVILILPCMAFGVSEAVFVSMNICFRYAGFNNTFI